MTREEKRDRRIYRQAHVRSLFDSIAYRYDFLNHTLSSGLDILWRRRAVRLLQQLHPRRILDVATGTADLAIETAWLNPERVIGVDISTKMLEIARAKIIKKNLEDIITLESGEAEHLRFESGSFDVVMTAFGVRNFENLELGLREFHRVLRSGGTAMILEFSKPSRSPVKQFYQFYSRYLLPLLGGLISRNRSAYEYLPSTIMEFPDGEEFCKCLLSAGFSSAAWYPQTFGIASIYMAVKA
ncbi:MAG: bifunctional demethylmenaquinone methyltransferase/2-methoxy-6-polyprenyl-1,4-benzoquinol methylase UbiE [Bacteroidota bacterium]